MLEELSKKDKLWREFAFRICGDKNTADDIVQEMYLRRLNNNRGQKTTDYYIFCTMKSIYLNIKKGNRLICVGEVRSDKLEDDKFEPTDEEQELLDKANKLSYTKRELLELNYDNSLRDIQQEFGINYVYVHRSVQEARRKILGKNIHQYNNKRLKHRKMSKSKGLGDTVEKLTKATGIKKLVDFISGEKDCGCEERKEMLNKLWKYKYKPECLTEDQIKDYRKFIDTREIKLTGAGGAIGKLSNKEFGFVLDFFSVVFNRERLKLSCRSCSGTSKILTQMIYKLDTVFDVNVSEEKTKIKRA